jgi:hypothetical protein
MQKSLWTFRADNAGRRDGVCTKLFVRSDSEVCCVVEEMVYGIRCGVASIRQCSLRKGEMVSARSLQRLSTPYMKHVAQSS